MSKFKHDPKKFTLGKLKDMVSSEINKIMKYKNSNFSYRNSLLFTY